MRIPGVWLALAAAFLFGVSGVVAADAFDAVDPLKTAQVRSVLAALVLGAVAHRRGRAGMAGQGGWLVVFGGFLAGVTITYYWAIDRLGVGPGVTLQFLGPTLVLVWMRAVQGRRVPWQGWTAAGLAVVGTGLMSQAWDVRSVDLLGVAAGLGAAVTFAGYLVVGERLGRHLPGITVTAYGFGVSALVFLVAVPLDVPQVDAVVWGQLLWVGLAGTAAPFLLEVAALRRDDPGRVGVVATAEPVVAAVTAWIALGQVLTPAQIVGGVFTVAGVAVIQAVTHSVAPDVPQAAV